MRRGSLAIFSWASVIMIFAAVLLTVVELVSYSRIRSNFPSGMVIANVPVGGLDQQHAADRLMQAYSVPVELHYDDAVIQVKPSLVGFELDLQAMLAAADLQRMEQPFWSAFWDYLWGQSKQPQKIPLRSSISDERLRSFLSDEISPRYDLPPSSPVPSAQSVNFKTGDPGRQLDVDRAIVLISDALRSPSSRIVNLSTNQVGTLRPTLPNLDLLIKQIIDNSKFSGIVELYMLDLQNYDELHFAYSQGQEITPDVAFTAASTIKIPIMVSAYSRVGNSMSQNINDLIDSMIVQSENDPADALMNQIIDKGIGPAKITEDLKKLGFVNTFLAGYFYPGAQLFAQIQTPANLRTDINTNPDKYSQTTPMEIGLLLFDIYQCAQNGSGTFAAVFPGKITQSKCQSMIATLSRNRVGLLMQAGLPEGTKIANKQGWITESDGLLHTVGDAGIIYTPGGDYILSIFVHDPKQLLFDPANDLVSKLTQATYNYYNINRP